MSDLQIQNLRKTKALKLLTTIEIESTLGGSKQDIISEEMDIINSYNNTITIDGDLTNPLYTDPPEILL
jgi:hypothetical protein